MDIAGARDFVARSARDAGGDNSMYTAVDYDRAIQHAGDEFCRLTKAITRVDTVQITANSADFPLSDPITNGFAPEAVMRIWINGQAKSLRIVDYTEINRLSVEGVPEEAYPTHIAFISPTSATATIWPTPTVNYTAKMLFWQPLGVTKAGVFTVGWTPGDESNTDAVLNIPDRLIRPVLNDGAVSVLKKPSPEEQYEMTSWKRFLEYCARCSGANNMGSQVVYSRRSSDMGRTPRRVIREIY